MIYTVPKPVLLKSLAGNIFSQLLSQRYLSNIESAWKGQHIECGKREDYHYTEI